MKKWITLFVLAGGLTIGPIAAETITPIADVVPVVQPADHADAQLTGCSKGTSGKQGWSLCTGSTANWPYTTQHVIVVTCVKWSWLGGGSYDATGDWAGKNSWSIVNCATYYNATNPRILFR